MSIRKRLLIMVLGVIAGAGGMSVWTSYRDARYEVQELFDAQLARSARLMLSLVLTEQNDEGLQRLQKLMLENRLDIGVYGDNEDEELTEHGHLYEIKLAFQVWDGEGNLVLRGGNTPLRPLADFRPGYSDSVMEGQQWRVFTLWNTGENYRVMAAESYDVRNELIDKIAREVLLPYLGLLPALAVLLWFVIGQGLRPLKQLALEVVNRDEYNFHPLELHPVPGEIQPIAEGLNKLLERLEQSFAKERRFTADASHELRTPLAALRTHLELARTTQSRKELDHEFTQLLTGVDRATRVVEQLLILARLEPDAVMAKNEDVDLRSVVVEVAADMAPFALRKSIDIEVQESLPRIIRADVAMLGILIRNLVDNAIRYTADGGQVKLSFSNTDTTVCLEVIDSGPGIPVDQRQRVFERFVRGDTGESNGCGIGLSIVKRIAELHHAQVELDDPVHQNGLKVTVCFPQVLVSRHRGRTHLFSEHE